MNLIKKIIAYFKNKREEKKRQEIYRKKLEELRRETHLYIKITNLFRIYIYILMESNLLQ